MRLIRRFARLGLALAGLACLSRGLHHHQSGARCGRRRHRYQHSLAIAKHVHAQLMEGQPRPCIQLNSVSVRSARAAAARARQHRRCRCRAHRLCRVCAGAGCPRPGPVAGTPRAAARRRVTGGLRRRPPARARKRAALPCVRLRCGDIAGSDPATRPDRHPIRPPRRGPDARAARTPRWRASTTCSRPGWREAGWRPRSSDSVRSEHCIPRRSARLQQRP